MTSEIYIAGAIVIPLLSWMLWASMAVARIDQRLKDLEARIAKLEDQVSLLIHVLSKFSER